ncbi:aconitate hydratase AcnA [Sulfobacillus harzensis]|uniref:Aconitate hydratase n=1 Tax=Sulfobacillus harzensis TaxID=2729629 RepID=A0A7Y0Q444_9FIRM|nr:aconitate hydratase AcnA [Sulfobacillus harzensis]NMP24948.1 aconitate hydratase AcnA [Sulfobacillus harzensis]
MAIDAHFLSEVNSLTVANKHDPFGAKADARVDGQPITYYRLSALEKLSGAQVSRLPFSIKVLLESLLRQLDNYQINPEDVEALARWSPDQPSRREIPFKPARVVLQDFTGVPAVVDLAALRSVMERHHGDPAKINPLVPVDLVIDHSVQVDQFGRLEALEFNMEREFERNQERYRFLNWAQKSFNNFRVVPPATGIVHQVNLEYLASVVAHKTADGQRVVFPDSVVGTDSHTTMINGLGVLGWGVGGIEAEANMLGQPLYFVTPQVVGFRLTGKLKEGATATDLALTITERLRRHGVVGKFVEFFGTGLSHMSLADRATIANMAPEYGATMGYFPVDAETLRYLKETGRSSEHIALVEWYMKEQGLFRTDDTPDPLFSDVLELDLGTVEPSLAGPKRPQDRVPLSAMKPTFEKALTAPVAERGFGLSPDDVAKTATVHHPDGTQEELKNGSVVIAAITSCTNTSNPMVMIGAGLLAKKAAERGIKPPQYVKTSLAPGSRVVSAYLERAGLMPYLNQLGFEVVGYGCTTCIGNSGPLPEAVSEAIQSGDLTVAAVLSGNRNFEGRIHAQVKANYLASPPLVVAYALAGTVDIDLQHDPLAHDANGNPVFLKDIWPNTEEILATLNDAIKPELFREQYETVFSANDRWNHMGAPEGQLYQWDANSTYIQEPPFFTDWSPEPRHLHPIHNARVLAILGDSVTTDHISPAGNIAVKSPAAKYLMEHGVEPKDFNSYGARRGNHEVMMRGTFANIRIRNLMLPGVEGGVSVHWPDGQQDSIYDVAMRYQAEGVPLVVLAGKEYGTGSSRDWAAKGTALLGVKAVIAESFERIHRSNLVGMGVLPLQFPDGTNAQTLGLTGEEVISLDVPQDIKPGQQVTIEAKRPNGEVVRFTATARLDTPVDVDYYRNGGILQTVLGNLAQ